MIIYCMATQYLRFYFIVLLTSWDLVDNEEGAHSKHFKHWEAGYSAMLPTKAHKGMTTTGWANICVWPVHLRPESRKCGRWQPDHIHHGRRRCRESISSTSSQGRRLSRKGAFVSSRVQVIQFHLKEVAEDLVFFVGIVSHWSKHFWRLLCHPTQAGVGLMWNCMQIIGHSRQVFWCYGVLHQHR